MKIYKNTITLTCIAILLSFAALLCGHEYIVKNCEWISDFLIGLIASGLLLVGTSAIGYLNEKKRTYKKFLCTLLDLQRISLKANTLIKGSGDYWEELLDITLEMDRLFDKELYLMDDAFITVYNIKTQKLLEIATKLWSYRENVRGALMKLSEYHAVSGDSDRYSLNELKKDLSDYFSYLDNFDHTGMFLSKWLEKKIYEYKRTVWPKAKR